MSEIRYPRRFKSNGVDYMAGGYVEFATADSFGVWVPKTHCDSQRWNDRRKITINDAEEVVAGGVWVETFDHHKPQYEPETVAFSEVDKLRAALDEFKTAKVKLKANLYDEQRHVAKLQSKNAKLRAEVDRLTKERDELRNEVASIGMLLSESKSNCDELRAKLANLPTGCDYDEFVQSRKAQPNLLPNQTDTDMLHGAIGIVTEAGELLDALKKQHFYGRELNRTNVIEELGDLEFYLSLCRNTLGVSRREVIDANVRKLELRYKERFTKEESENRDTDAESKAIENATQPAAEWPEVWQAKRGEALLQVTFTHENDQAESVPVNDYARLNGYGRVSWHRRSFIDHGVVSGYKLISKGGKAVLNG